MLTQSLLRVVYKNSSSHAKSAPFGIRSPVTDIISFFRVILLANFNIALHQGLGFFTLKFLRKKKCMPHEL